MALALAPAGVAEKSQALRPTTKGRMAFSTGLCRLPDYAASAESRTRLIGGSLFRNVRVVGIIKGSQGTGVTGREAYIASA